MKVKSMIDFIQVIAFGCTMVIREKFSASKFFSECAQHNCTAAQYVGELCRYILAQPKRDTDTKHKVKFWNVRLLHFDMVLLFLTQLFGKKKRWPSGLLPNSVLAML